MIDPGDGLVTWDEYETDTDQMWEAVAQWMRTFGTDEKPGDPPFVVQCHALDPEYRRKPWTWAERRTMCELYLEFAKNAERISEMRSSIFVKHEEVDDVWKRIRLQMDKLWGRMVNGDSLGY